MKSVQNWMFVPALIALLSCGNSEPSAATAAVVQIPTLQKRAESPAVKSITRFKTGPEDDKGTLLSKELFDKNGHKTKSLGYDYYGSGEQTDQITYTYDAQGREIKSVTEDAGVVTTTFKQYNTAGQVAKSGWSRNDDSGETQEHTYDSHGNETEIKYFKLDGTHDYTRVFFLEYDADDHLVSEQRWEQYTDGTEDLMQYHLKMTYENGKLMSKTWLPDAGLETRKEIFRYDDNGSLVETLTYEGTELDSREVNELNEFGEVVVERVYNGMDSLQYTNTYTYDKYGHQLRMMYVHEDGDAWGERTEYEYMK